MYLVLYLGEQLQLDFRPGDSRVLHNDGRDFADIYDAWPSSFYLGFYDWLRSASSSHIVGVQLILHDGRDVIRDLVRDREYIEWLSQDLVRLYFDRRPVLDEALSVDQEFSVSRCLRANDGTVALLFDACELTEAQVANLSQAFR